MKKLIASLLSAALVTSAFANTTVTLVGSEDNSANVSVQVKSDSDVYGIQFDLKYDATELSIDDKALSSLVNGIHDVYAKAKSEEGLIRVVMFDVGGKELHSDASSITNIISIPFTLNDSKSVSTLLEFDNLVHQHSRNQSKYHKAEFEVLVLATDPILPSQGYRDLVT